MKRNPLSCSVFCVVLLAVIAHGQYDPHPKGSYYKEPFRGQYHFSPKTEWMNDINALIYLDGKYHMIYQWGKKIRHGGYATSRDLLHWKDEGVALIPQETFLPKEAARNVSGAQVYSGSGVVVSGPTAEKITGSPKEAMIIIYTGTKCGTCLAWSNDGGVQGRFYCGKLDSDGTSNLGWTYADDNVSGYAFAASGDIPLGALSNWFSRNAPGNAG